MLRRFAGTIRNQINVEESFIITVDIASNGDSFTLPLTVGGLYNFVSDWGDGTDDTITTFNQAEVTHTYTTAGQYDIAMNGTIEGWQFNNAGDKLKILDVKQWGGVNGVKILGTNAFYGCSNLDVTATDLPDFSLATDLGSTFRDCSSLVGNTSFNNWDVSGNTTFIRFFFNCSNFNQDISSWDVSSADSLAFMFEGCTNFNQNLGAWNVSSIRFFNSMFENSGFNNGGSANINTWVISTTLNVEFISMFRSCPFNQNIGSWDTQSVVTFASMFLSNSSFNQDIGTWNTGAVTSMNSMFFNATAFNQNIGGWNLSVCTNINDMFRGASNFNNGGSATIDNWNTSSLNDLIRTFRDATSFNQSINSWDVTGVVSFQEAFFGASAFNQSLNSWTLTSALSLNQTFRNATALNQDFDLWDVSGVTAMNSVFDGCTNFNGNVDNWNVSSATTLAGCFRSCSSFNRDITGWTPSSCTNFNVMFDSTTIFDRDIGGWNITAMTSAVNMFAGTIGLSVVNYDALLVGWDAQAVQNNVTLDVNQNYTSGGAADTARTNLINDHTWTINDNGGI